MFVVFYRSGQKPGAVKVCNEGGREEELSVTVNPVFIERDTNDKQRWAGLPQRPAHLIDARRRRKDEKGKNKVFAC